MWINSAELSTALGSARGFKKHKENTYFRRILAFCYGEHTYFKLVMDGLTASNIPLQLLAAIEGEM